MSDITFTPADVVAANAATVKSSGLSGAAIDIGQSVYLDPADNSIKPAQADSGSPTAPPNIVGVALNSAPGANQPVTYATSGDVDFGSGLTQGEGYVVSSANPGGIAPYSDLASTDFVAFLGVALNSTTLRLGLIPTSTQV